MNTRSITAGGTTMFDALNPAAALDLDVQAFLSRLEASDSPATLAGLVLQS